MRASYSSLFGQDQFVLEFADKTLKHLGPRAQEPQLTCRCLQPRQFYLGMPQQFMGMPNRGLSRTEGVETTVTRHDTKPGDDLRTGPVISNDFANRSDAELVQSQKSSCEISRGHRAEGHLLHELPGHGAKEAHEQRTPSLILAALQVEVLLAPALSLHIFEAGLF